MPARYIGAVDQGTTSTRFIVFDRRGRIVSTAQKEHRQVYPKPGWVEHDPSEIWRNTREVIAAAMRRASLKPSDLAAIGITNQRETTVVWERKTGRPVHNALVWQDTRVEGEVARLTRQGGQDRFRKKTGLPLATYFSALKLRWILDHVPGARRRAKAGELLFGTIDSFLLWNLTGGIHATDRLGSRPACYALEGSVAIAGALVQWLRDNLGLIAKSADVEALARWASDNGGVYFVPAFSGLYAPHWKATARGVIAGLTRYAGKAHLARAALEATAFQTLEVALAMEKDSGVRLSLLRADGGMTANELLMQFQADILDRPVVRPVVSEMTALGAAYAAGLAVGYYSGLRELSDNWKVSRTWKPRMKAAERTALFRDWQKAVRRSFDWIEV